MDKTALRAALVRQLEADLALQTQAALTSHDEATHEESKAENQYDMHAQEAAYLAEGQARMVAELRETVGQFSTMPVTAFRDSDPIAIGAVITLSEGKGSTSRVVMGPRAGGLEIELGGERYLVVTPASPLGRQLLGRRVGDSVKVPGKGTVIAQRITQIA